LLFFISLPKPLSFLFLCLFLAIFHLFFYFLYTEYKPVEICVVVLRMHKNVIA
jgi:hypothetical protein